MYHWDVNVQRFALKKSGGFLKVPKSVSVDIGIGPMSYFFFRDCHAKLALEFPNSFYFYLFIYFGRTWEIDSMN